jgi:hypothetical protein
MTVVKTRSRPHTTDLRAYDIASAGIVIGDRLEGYKGITGGTPQATTRDLADRTGPQRAFVTRVVRRELRSVEQADDEERPPRSFDRVAARRYRTEHVRARRDASGRGVSTRP